DRITLLKDCEAAVTAGADDACDSVRSPAEKRAAHAKAELEAIALSAARLTFREGGATTRLERVEACSRVLLATAGLKGAGDATNAAVLDVCRGLTASSNSRQ